MLAVAAAEYAQKAPWVVLFPGAATRLAVFGANLLGDALRDTLLAPAGTVSPSSPKTCVLASSAGPATMPTRRWNL